VTGTGAVRVSVVLDSVDPRAIAGFWCEALGYREVGDLGQFVVLAPPRGEPGPVMILQGVPEERAGKNRAHLDLHPPDAEAHIARLERLGAHRVGARVTELQERIGVWWQPMADPQGNEFCVVADPPPGTADTADTAADAPSGAALQPETD
jgi:predicted enzyme related to lactoylglutathione lyase